MDIHKSCDHNYSNLIVNSLKNNLFFTGIILQTQDKDLEDWLYAMDPLLAGTIRYLHTSCIMPSWSMLSHMYRSEENARKK